MGGNIYKTTCKHSRENYFLNRTIQMNLKNTTDYWAHPIQYIQYKWPNIAKLGSYQWSTNVCNIFIHCIFTYLASPVAVSTWLTQALYTSTGLVLMPKFLSSMMSLTTGASSCLSVLWPRAPLLKLTTILMTVGFPVTMSWIWSTLELRHMGEKVPADQ